MAFVSVDVFFHFEYISQIIRTDIELQKYGYTTGCPGCIAAEAGSKPVSHNAECRWRIEQRMAEDSESKERLEKAVRARTGGRMPTGMEATSSSSPAAGSEPAPAGATCLVVPSVPIQSYSNPGLQ